MQDQKLIVVRCLTYNQESTIRQCLEGIVSQDTEYPFVAVVHDDASTDKTADIVREYAAKYPDKIRPILETENQYSKGTLKEIMERACGEYTAAKYYAICEGDDYWTDRHKLQKQVEFLEKHPEYAMCCCNASILTSSGELDWTISEVDTDLPIENLIKKGGLYIATAGIVYRKSVKDNYPECCVKCKVGDHPLQIMCGLKGKVRYFSDKMVVYRYAMNNSWSATRKNEDIKKLTTSWNSTLVMLKGLNEYSDYKYDKFFNEGALLITLSNIGNHLTYSKMILNGLLEEFPDCLKYAGSKEKLKLFLINHNLTFIWRAGKRLKNLKH